MRQYCQKQHVAVYSVKGHTSLRERGLQFSRFNFCQVSDSYSLLTIVKQQEIISEAFSGVRVTVINSESMITPRYCIRLAGSSTDLSGWIMNPKDRNSCTVSNTLQAYAILVSTSKNESSKNAVEKCPSLSRWQTQVSSVLWIYGELVPVHLACN